MSVTPSGFAAFCARDPGQCRPGAASATLIDLDTATWDEIVHVDREINAQIRPESDQQHYGQTEYWTIATDGYGDCEDFALTKRKALIDAGLPERALRMAIVVTLTGEEHAVLTVATNRGDFVLDNLTNDVLAWNQTGYAWVARQDAGGRMGWVAFNAGDADKIRSVASLSTD